MAGAWCQVSFDLANVHAADLPLASCPETGRPSVRLNSYGQFRPARLSVPTTSSTSRDQTVFIDRAIGASLSSYAVLLENDRFG